MKTVCKKLLCLMLVAMMLVSAVPFAFAAETDEYTLQVAVLKDGKNKGTFSRGLDSESELDAWMDRFNLDAGSALTEFSIVIPDNATYTVEINKDGKLLAVTVKITTEGYVAPTEPVETEPVVTEPVETEPVVTEPVETEPVETEPAPTTYTLSFYYLNAKGAQVVTTKEVMNNEKVTFPVIPLVSTKDFLYWEDGDGTIYKENSTPTWNIGESQTFVAVYENNSTEDGLVPLNVWANFYVDGVYHHREYLYTEYFEETEKNTMFTWLYSDTGVRQTKQAVFGNGDNDGYQWTPVIYYNYYGDGAITEADMKSDGPKTVYIKVTSTDAIESNVLLYVHTKQTSTVDRVIPMNGYTAGDYVSYADVKAAVKTKYSGSSMTISDLYTQAEWEDLLAGKDATGAASVKVTSNGTTKIHVIVKNATGTSSSVADDSNPKTGDNIMIAVGAMAMSAAALVSIIELKKRKMI